MKKALLLSAIMISGIVLLVSCSKDGDDNNGNDITCGTVTYSFSADVNPLIQTYCNQAGCHNVASVNGPGPITNYNQVFNARASIRTAIHSGSMPRNTTLSREQKTKIICWIDGGAPNN